MFQKVDNPLPAEPPIRAATSWFKTIEEITEANEAAGKHWFSAETVEYFKPKVETRVYVAPARPMWPRGSRLWVESKLLHVLQDGSPRVFLIMRFDVLTHDVMYASIDNRVLRFSNLNAAIRVLEAML